MLLKTTFQKQPPGKAPENKHIGENKEIEGSPFTKETHDTKAGSTKPSSPVEKVAPGIISEILALDAEKLLQGVIMSEILGKPRARRKGRW